MLVKSNTSECKSFNYLFYDFLFCPKIAVIKHLTEKEAFVMENEKRLHRCCFTGHRPEKLSLSEAEVKSLSEKAINTAIENGFTTFITGMAPGVDIWAVEIVLEKRKHNTSLHLICAMPHPGFEKRKSKYEEDRCQNIIDNADYTQTICDRYFRACYQRRNEFMVDHSNLVIAVWNGEKIGTKNTIDYAKRKGVELINIYEQFIK